MGCGTSHNVRERRFSSSISHPVDHESDSESEDDSHTVCSTPSMDKLWKIKRLLYDHESADDSDISLDAFALRTGIEICDMYKALKIFNKTSNLAKLDVESLAQRLNWPSPQNMILNRLNPQ